jgi:hypothetical protein
MTAGIKLRLLKSQWEEVEINKKEMKKFEAPGIDPGTSIMLSERSTIWATPPSRVELVQKCGFEEGTNKQRSDAKKLENDKKREKI